MTAPGAALWTPSTERVARSNLSAFVAALAAGDFPDYAAVHRWSVEHREQFWPALWRFADVMAEPRASDPWASVGTGLDRMAPPDPVQGPWWFPGARLNFAENLLRTRGDGPALVFWNESGRQRTRGDGPALVFWNESGRQRELSRAELVAEVGRVQAALLAHGIVPGDRVAGLMPNLPETAIAMLAATSLGAIWSSCSPDFGTDGAVDRFGQIAPRILFCADGYVYGGKSIDTLERVAGVARRIPAIERVVVVPYLAERPRLAAVPRAASWRDWSGTAGAAPRFERVDFNHPLYILYSSGTTGLPKCMVHGAGGTLLQHTKEHLLHVDLKPGDRFFYFTTCGWMMWNWLLSGLASGATVVLYDGSPLARGADILFELAEQERLSVFGASAKFIALAEKQSLAPARTHDLAALRTIVSTGSPLAGHSYDYVYQRVKRDVHLCNISGGTELISCFAIGNPWDPVRRGEMQGPGLGMAVDVFAPDGTPLRGAAGELVCTRPFPSMPVRFWNDEGGAKYRAAYFERFPGAWRHGDWAERTTSGGIVIHGRSDATLNPGGVRIGTAELYRQVEQLPEVLECLAIGQRMDGSDDERVVLFVRLKEGLTLDEALRVRIKGHIKEHASPRHVPARIVQVADIPRTISGKISELAVRAVVHGQRVDNKDALANPESLELFRDLPELAS